MMDLKRRDFLRTLYPSRMPILQYVIWTKIEALGLEIQVFRSSFSLRIDAGQDFLRQYKFRQKRYRDCNNARIMGY